MTDRSTPPPLRPFDIRDIAEPEKTVLADGVPLYVFNSDAADVVRIDLVFRGGRWDQTFPLQSVFTLRMLKEGTLHMDSSTVAERLDFYGAWLEHYVTHSRSVLTLYSLNSYLPQTLDVLEQMVKEPAFDGDRLQTVLGMNIQRFAVNERRTDCKAQRKLMNALFGDRHPEGHSLTIEDYRAVNVDMLKQFYAEYYRSANLTVCLSGHVTDDCLRRVSAIFGTPFGVQTAGSKMHTWQPQTVTEKSFFVEKEDAQQSSVAMGLLTVGAGHPDFPKLRIAVTLLGGFFGSRFMSNIREKKGYTYGIGSSLITCPTNNILFIAADCSNEHAEPLIAEVYKEIDRLQQEPVGQAELETVCNYMIGDSIRNVETALSLVDVWIMNHEQIEQPDLFRRSVEAIGTVTPDDIMRLARTYFSKEMLKEVVCGRKM